MLQCGDPTGTGSGGPGYQFGVENAPADGNYPAGTRRDGPHLRPEQQRQPVLPGLQGHRSCRTRTATRSSGTITKGLDVVSKVADAGTDDAGGDGAPKQKVTIETVTIGKS